MFCFPVIILDSRVTQKGLLLMRTTAFIATSSSNSAEGCGNSKRPGITIRWLHGVPNPLDGLLPARETCQKSSFSVMWAVSSLRIPWPGPACLPLFWLRSLFMPKPMLCRWFSTIQNSIQPWWTPSTCQDWRPRPRTGNSFLVRTWVCRWCRIKSAANWATAFLAFKTYGVDAMTMSPPLWLTTQKTTSSNRWKMAGTFLTFLQPGSRSTMSMQRRATTAVSRKTGTSLCKSC